MGHSTGLIPIPRLAEGESKWGGAVSPTLTCSTEVYVYEVIFEERGSTHQASAD